MGPRGNRYQAVQPKSFVWRAPFWGAGELESSLAGGRRGLASAVFFFFFCSLATGPGLLPGAGTTAQHRIPTQPLVPESPPSSKLSSSCRILPGVGWLALLLPSRAFGPFCDCLGNVSPAQPHTPHPLLVSPWHAHICMRPFALGLNVTNNEMVKFIFWIFQAL